MSAINQNSSVCFLASKPLQIMVASIIAGQINSTNNTLIIANEFAMSYSVFENIKRNKKFFSKVFYVDSKKSGYKFIINNKFNYIFIDSDVGLKNFINQLLIKIKSGLNSKFIVFEEGFGTYRDDLYVKWKTKLLSFFGVGAFFGQSILTSGLFLFNPNKYRVNIRNRALVEIEFSLQNHIESNMDYYRSVFDFYGHSLIYTSSNRRCALYLSDWIYSQVGIDLLTDYKNQGCDVFIKPHPHMRGDEISKETGIPFFSGGVPVELILLDLNNKYEEIVAIHHGSSVVNYIHTSKIKYQNLNEI